MRVFSSYDDDIANDVRHDNKEDWSTTTTTPVVVPPQRNDIPTETTTRRYRPRLGRQQRLQPRRTSIRPSNRLPQTSLFATALLSVSGDDSETEYNGEDHVINDRSSGSNDDSIVNNVDNNLFFGGILLSRKKFLRAIQSVLITTPFLVEIYSRLGSIFPNNQLPSGEELVTSSTSLGSRTNSSSSGSSSSNNSEIDWTTVKHVTFVFHGAGGQDSYTDDLMKNLNNDLSTVQDNSSSSSSSSSLSVCRIIDWSEYSTNLFQASYNGEAIGRRVAQYISTKSTPNLQTVHIIGISVGAFAANMAATEWKKSRIIKPIDNTSVVTTSSSSSTSSSLLQPYVQLTLLDPFTQRGIFGVGYGQNNFGRSSNINYTQQFLNVDDPVPSTNSPLPYAVCYDVTPIRPSNIFGHDWPLVYYATKHLVLETEKEDSLSSPSSSHQSRRRQVFPVGIVPPDQRASPGQVITIQQ